MGCPTLVNLGDNVVFSICTHDPDTGILTDADEAPTWRMYEDETAAAILNGSMAKLDDGNTTGFYTETVACTAGNGFEKAKTYTVYIEATVDSDKGGICYGFKVEELASLTDVQTSCEAAIDAKFTFSGANVDAQVAGIDDIDFSATMKTSLDASTPASVTTVTGNVNGNVGGNVTGSVGSVIGAVGSVTGAVGSVTGNVGGNVTGSVGSVVGAVGSVTGNVGGNVTGSVGSVVGAVGSVTGNVGGNVTGSIGSLAAQAKTDVNGEVVDALNTDTYAEPGQGNPPATATLVQKIGYLYKAWRNKRDTVNNAKRYYNDAGAVVDQKRTLSDDGTTYIETEVESGP